MPHPLLNLSQLDYMIQVGYTKSHTLWQAVQIQVSSGSTLFANRANLVWGGTGLNLFIPRHMIVGGIMVSHWMSVCLSILQSVSHTSVRISFPDDNLRKHQWIFTKLGVCIDIVEIWFGIANGRISSNFDGVICPILVHIFVSER